MRKFHSNLAFVDLLFNMLTGFVTLFIIAFLMINPVAESGKIDPKVEFMVTLEWDDDSYNDIDLWMMAPGLEQPIGFAGKSRGVYHLERDDTGINGDLVVVDGRETFVKKNIETINIRAVQPGEYIVNTHFYRRFNLERKNSADRYYEVRKTEKVTVTVYDMEPYKIVGSITYTIERVREERTAFSFIITEDGNIVDVRTDIQIPIVPHHAIAANEGP